MYVYVLLSTTVIHDTPQTQLLHSTILSITASMLSSQGERKCSVIFTQILSSSLTFLWSVLQLADLSSKVAP